MNLVEIAKRYAGGLETLIDWLGSGGVCVNIPKAQSRTDTCLKCVHNKPGGIVPESVSAAIKRQVQLKNEIGLKTEGMDGLRSCELCACPLPLKIFVPLESLGVSEQEAIEEFPNFCWLNTEYKQKHETDKN